MNVEDFVEDFIVAGAILAVIGDWKCQSKGGRAAIVFLMSIPHSFRREANKAR